MKRSGPIKRKARLKAKGGHRFPKVVVGGLREWIREQPCILGDQRLTKCCHVKSRGAGGGDLKNIVPMCMIHHAEQHAIGIDTFQQKYSVDLVTLAEEYTNRWLDETQFLGSQPR